MSGSRLVSSEMKRSSVRSHCSGSTWLMPMRYPTSRATDEPAPPARRPLLQRNLGVRQPAFLHDPLRDLHDFPVQQQETRQVVQLDQPELFPQPLRHLGSDRAVTPRGRLVAELLQVAVRRVALRHVGVGQGVAQVGAQVELAHTGNPPRVGDGFGIVPEQLLHIPPGGFWYR